MVRLCIIHSWILKCIQKCLKIKYLWSLITQFYIFNRICYINLNLSNFIKVLHTECNLKLYLKTIQCVYLQPTYLYRMLNAFNCKLSPSIIKLYEVINCIREELWFTNIPWAALLWSARVAMSCNCFLCSSLRPWVKAWYHTGLRFWIAVYGGKEGEGKNIRYDNNQFEFQDRETLSTPPKKDLSLITF